MSRSPIRGAKRVAVVTALAALCGFVALAISLSSRGDAAYPGSNGKIAYAFGDAYLTSIWSANPDGSAPTQLTHGTGDWAPAYSANGSRIAFSRDGGIAVMNADGSGLAQLASGSYTESSETEWVKNYETPGPSSEIIPWVKIRDSVESWHSYWDAAFSPDGSQLAVEESQGKASFKEICAVEEDEDQACIPYDYEEPLNDDSYYDFDYECECSSRLATLSSTTGALTSEITPFSTTIEDLDPTYSSTGKIAFARHAGSSTTIFIINSPGAAPVQLTSGPRDFKPDFSPDGSRLVYNHGSREFGVIGSAGGPVTLLTVPNPPGATFSSARDAAFSPDGTRITFQRSVYGSGGKIEAGVFTMGADGSSPARIVNDGLDPNWQPVAPPPPPPLPVVKAKGKAKKGKVKLNKKGKAVIGEVVCGSSPCALKGLSSELTTKPPKKKKKKKKAGSSAVVTMAAKKKTCPAKVKVPKKLAPNKKGKVEVTVAGKCLGALKQAGKGKLVTKIQVNDAAGKKVVTLKTDLIPPKSKKPKKKKK